MIKTEKALTKTDLDIIHAAIARLRAHVMAVVFGFSGGTLLFLITIWLVIRGPAAPGEPVGPHLELLSQYFPGFEVSWVGSLIGFVYGALTGAVIGWVIAFVYNAIVDRRL
jgi:hypothetical protein